MNFNHGSFFMICIVTSRIELRLDLKKNLDKVKIKYRIVDPSDSQCLHALYDPAEEYTALIADTKIDILPQASWFDMIENLARRLPVIFINDGHFFDISGFEQRTELLTWLEKPSAEKILETLRSYGVIREIDIKGHKTIPLYHSLLAAHMLRKNTSLSVLSIDTGSFRDVSIEYGIDTYKKLNLCFHKIMLSLWGNQGSFRAQDLLCQASQGSHMYYILLEKSRSDVGLPPPEALEKLADRLMNKIQNLFWCEINKKEDERILPEILKFVPDLSIGFSSALYNPCVEVIDSVAALLERSKEVSAIQKSRMKNRRRELIQNLIQNDKLLNPKYQAVFWAKKITLGELKASQEKKSLKPLQKAIYAFESLIRVNQIPVETLLSESALKFLEAKYLTPDVLFMMAEGVHLALEFDQACLNLALKRFQHLPGFLLVNVLPRNFYFIDRLRFMIPKDARIIFEVSESEAIKNFDLLLEAKEKLAKDSYAIAIDDFGKGFAGLDRLLKVKPDMVKLDRDLIENIHLDKVKQSFVEGLIKTARLTQCLILAEGIELVEEFKVLKELGVDLVQGFLFHRPGECSLLQEELGIETKEEDLLAS